MRFIFAIGLIINFVFPAYAGNIQISPVSIDVVAPAAASSIALKNTGDEAIKIQARLFSWKQENGDEVLEKTADVVVSPPFLNLKPGGNAVVRIVRLSKLPIAGEESYRLLIDELPSKVSPRGTNVRMVMRYSVPVFFNTGTPDAPKIVMSAHQQNGKVIVTATNNGATRLKLTRMKAADVSGRSVTFGEGLNGYVLAGSSNNFPANSKSSLRGLKLSISAKSNFGDITMFVPLK